MDGIRETLPSWLLRCARLAQLYFRIGSGGGHGIKVFRQAGPHIAGLLVDQGCGIPADHSGGVGFDVGLDTGADRGVP